MEKIFLAILLIAASNNLKADYADVMAKVDYLNIDQNMLAYLKPSHKSGGPLLSQELALHNYNFGFLKNYHDWNKPSGFSSFRRLLQRPNPYSELRLQLPAFSEKVFIKAKDLDLVKEQFFANDQTKTYQTQVKKSRKIAMGLVAVATVLIAGSFGIKGFQEEDSNPVFWTLVTGIIIDWFIYSHQNKKLQKYYNTELWKIIEKVALKKDQLPEGSLCL